jgi:hypothetical protein
MRLVWGFVGIVPIVLSAACLEAQTGIGAQDARAIFTPTEVRLVFPVAASRVSSTQSDESGSGIWEVGWERSDYRPGIDPFQIWIVLPSGYPWKSARPQSVGALRPQAMIDCMTCDAAALVDTRIAASELTATIENQSLVFTVHGTRAINLIFPSIPHEISFGFPGSGQRVKVNCGNGYSAAKYRRECVIPPPVRPPDADSAARENAPRRVNVLVANFADAKLLREVSVLMRMSTSPRARRMRSDSAGRIVLRQPPIGNMMIEALCKAEAGGKETVFGTQYIQIVPRIDTTVWVVADRNLCAK